MPDYKTMDSADVSGCARLFMETFNAPPWNDGWTVDTAEKRLSRMVRAEGSYGLCAYLDGELCGMIIGCAEQYYDGIRFEIREFCVSNRLRGKGLGSQILGRFEDDLKKMNISEVILITSKGEQTERFYNKHGFGNLDGMTLMGKRF